MDQLMKAGRLAKDSKRSSMESQSKLQAQQLLLQGWAQKCIWVSDTDCSVEVPSQSNPSKMWLVDLPRGTCTCPSSAQGGMCKHFHIAANVAAMRNVDVDATRSALAAELLRRGQFVIHGTEVMVFDQDSLSHVSGQHCTCIAASQGIDCICSRLAAHLSRDKTDEEVNLPDDQGREAVAMPSVDPRVIARQQLLELQTWVESDEFGSHSRQLQIQREMHLLHGMVFGRRFRNITRKRRIEPNSSYRQAVEAALKRKRLRKDHGYAAMAAKKGTGDFKKARSMKGVRKSFTS